jgi:hypothetical protein
MRLEVVAHWPYRKRKLSNVAEQVRRLAVEFAAVDPRLQTVSTLRERKRGKPISLDLVELEKILERGLLRDDDGKLMGGGDGHFTGCFGDDQLFLVCHLDFLTTSGDERLETIIEATANLSPEKLCQRVLAAGAFAFDCDWAYAAGFNYARALNLVAWEPIAGWLTYARVREVPHAPQPLDLEPLGAGTLFALSGVAFGAQSDAQSRELTTWFQKWGIHRLPIYSE